MRPMKRWIPVAAFIFIGVVIGILFASNMHWVSVGNAARRETASDPTDETQVLLPDARRFSDAFVAVTKQVLPSVVAIYTTKEIRRPADTDLFPPFFEEWFGRRFQLPQVPQKQTGLGSGVIVSRDGYILTNNHVIEGADEIKVELHDNRHFDAKIIGADPLTDVAVVKIEGQNLPVARLGNSDEVEVGEWVLAMGNPLGLNSTVTAGIVSALGRNIDILQDTEGAQGGGSYDIEDFIQTDAPINRGNSGGALVNLRGEVIGINAAIASGTGYYAGYGFAIPINLARKVMQDLIGKGYVTRAYLGIGMWPVNENIAQRFGLERVQGALIDQVMPDSPAEKAGLRRFDVILEVNGREVRQPSEVQSLIARMSPGDKVTLTIVREGKKREITVQLGQRETGKGIAQGKVDAEVPKLGLEVENLTDTLRRQFPYYKDDEGVLVTRVEPYSAAAEARILKGDLITAIEDIPIRNVADYRAVLRKFEKGKVVIFHLKRRDSKTAAFVKLPK